MMDIEGTSDVYFELYMDNNKKKKLKKLKKKERKLKRIGKKLKKHKKKLNKR